MNVDVGSFKALRDPLPAFGAGAQWGLASLTIGSVIFLASPILLLFNTIFAQGGRAGVPMGAAWTASMIGWSLLLLLAIASIGFGIRGIRLACREGQSLALGVAGTCMSIGGFLSWLIAGIDLIIVLARFS